MARKAKAVTVRMEVPFGLHRSCHERLKAKCRWEQATFYSVARRYPTLLCRTCRKKVQVAELRSFAKTVKEGECWVCKCTQNKACVSGALTCGWANSSRTLCSFCKTIADKVGQLKRILEVIGGQ